MASDERGVLGRSPRLLCNSSVSVPLCPCCWASTITPLPTSRLSAPPGVHEQVPLQPGLQARSQSGCGRVGQQSQFVENTSAKVVSNHREAVVGALELRKEKRSESELRGGGKKKKTVALQHSPPPSGWGSHVATPPSPPDAETDRGDLASVPGPGSYP